MRHGSRLRLFTDGLGRFKVEFPLQVQRGTLCVIADTSGHVPVMRFVEGTGNGEQFVPEREWSIVGLRAMADLTAAMEELLAHAFRIVPVKHASDARN